MDLFATAFLLLASAVTLASSNTCLDTTGKPTGQFCYGDEFCCNDGYSCCWEYRIGTWGIIGIVFAVILVLSILCSCCKVCARRKQIQDRQLRTQHRIPPNTMVAVIHPAPQQGAAPNWQYNQPPPPYTLYNLYPAPTYASDAPPAGPHHQQSTS